MNQPAVVARKSVTLSRDWLVIQLAESLEEPCESVAALEDHDDLVSCGMDSIRLMYLCERLRREGYVVSISDLSRTPTIVAWLGFPAQPDGVLVPRRWEQLSETVT